MHCVKNKLKRWRLKKALAASLAVVTAFASLPATSPAAADAAKPYVGLRTAFKTLQIGQTNRMTLRNNTLKWEITKVATNDRTIAMVYGKTKSSFMIKGKSAGRTTVKAKLKTAARKKYNTKTVSCRVNVTAPEEDISEAVVSDQEALEKALKSNNLKKLEISTNQAEKLVIPKGTYSNTELTVNAPAADIENNGTFKSITIQAIKPDTWFENAVGNVMRVMANAARIVVNQGARLEKLNLACIDAKISLEVNGTIDELSISAKLELSVSGNPEKPIPTVIEESAEDTVIETSAPLQVTANASASLTFQEGAEDSTVEVKSENANVEVKNYTNTTITVLKADGTVERKSPVRVTLSSPSLPSYSSVSYTPPSVSLPTSPDAIVTTGDSVETIPDEGAVNPGSPGDSGSSVPGFPEYASPTVDDFIKIMNPNLSLVVTSGGIDIITTSAILTLEIKPDAIQLNDNGYIQWRCPGVEGIEEEGAEESTDGGQGLEEWMKLEGSESKKILIPMPEMSIEDIITEQSLTFEIAFCYGNYGEYLYSQEIDILIYSQEAIQMVAWNGNTIHKTVTTLEIPYSMSLGNAVIYPNELSPYITDQQ